jgi:hypothetical protein
MDFQTQNIEKQLTLGLKLAGLAIAGYLWFEAARVNWDFPPAKEWPFVYRQYYHWIILPIHEGGHFLFMFFGRTLASLGGSFWQVMFPLLLAFVAFRKRSFFTYIYLTLAGAHLIPVAPYIFDANFRVLQLLGPKHGHDWYNLLYIQRNWIEYAAPLSQIAYFGGILLGFFGIAFGGGWAVYRYFRPEARKTQKAAVATNRA